MPINALCVAPLYNSPGINKHTGHVWADASAVFGPEAARFSAAYGHLPIYRYDNRNPLPTRFHDLTVALNGVANQLDTLAIFGHAWVKGCQAGITNANLHTFVEVCKTALAVDCTIVLYGCSAGGDADGDESDEKGKGPGGDGGFADLLRDALSEAGLRPHVFAHTVRGHATENPYVRYFPPGAGAGGNWVVEPGSGLWGKWGKALASSPKDRPWVRLHFPFWTNEQLEIELARY